MGGKGSVSTMNKMGMISIHKIRRQVCPLVGGVGPNVKIPPTQSLYCTINIIPIVLMVDTYPFPPILLIIQFECCTCCIHDIELANIWR